MNQTAAPHAPGELEFVRGFVNSLDIEAGTDQFRDAEAWAEWASQEKADDDDLAFARELREALREALLANHDRAPLPGPAAALLTEAARRAGATLVFDATGLTVATAAAGFPGVLGRVVSAVAAATADGTWARLKACRNDACQWAFFDSSRSRTGQWCSMAICGNRAKQSRYRDQRRS